MRICILIKLKKNTLVCFSGFVSCSTVNGSFFKCAVPCVSLPPGHLSRSSTAMEKIGDFM